MENDLKKKQGGIKTALFIFNLMLNG